MNFNSFIFCLFFLPCTVGGYFFLNHFKKYQAAKVFLLGMSFWFYGYNHIQYLLIMIASIMVNFLLSKGLLFSKNTIHAKVLLWLGICFNIGILVYFKYFDFFIENANFVLGTDMGLRNLLLPLGISFFTFQQLSFVLDSYKKKTPAYRILDYALFVSFFPQLVAGPIVLHSEIIPQFASKTKKNPDFQKIYKGLFLFAGGLGKKVLLADTFGRMVDIGYNNIPLLGSINAAVVMLAYTLQIYLDFSGYCDMACGIAYLFNIKLPQNFNSPYKALTVADFWKRWHMTLTRFFTTYVYIPLGGNRKGEARTLLNSFIVFFISGLWHGANWTFICWGIAHGIAIILSKSHQAFLAKIPIALSWLGTFFFINITWVLFRASSIGEAWAFYKELFSLRPVPILPDISAAVLQPEVTFVTETFTALLPSLSSYFGQPTVYLTLFFVGVLVVLLTTKNLLVKAENLQPCFKTSLKTSVLLVWSMLSFSGVSTFLYFNF